MLTYVKGNILSSGMQTLVCPVNCVGFMDGGLSLQFKKKFPSMFEEYKRQCNDNLLVIGGGWIYKKSAPWIYCFPTKKHWENRGELFDIEMGLDTFSQVYELFGIENAAFPKLGCGCGGLKWEEVCPVMEKYLAPLPIEITVYL